MTKRDDGGVVVAKEIFPFLYETLVERVLGSESYRDRVLIWAGRCLGKSGVLDVLESRLQTQSLETVTRVAGRTAVAVSEVANWATDPSGVLLIDDLDRAYDDEFEDVLSSLPEDSEGQWRVLATVCNLAEIEKRSGWSESPSINTFHREPLDPWESPAQASGAIKDALARLRKEHQGTWTPAPMLTGKAPELILAWAESLVEVSDGHPALLRAAFDGLARLLARNPSLPSVDQRLLTLPTDEAGQKRWHLEVREYLSDEIFSSAEGMGAISRAIKFYHRESPYFDSLVEVAGTPEGLRIASVKVRQSLRSSGLVRRHPGSGNLRVVGEMVRERILEIARQAPDLDDEGQQTKRRGRPKKRDSDPRPKEPKTEYHFRVDRIDSESGELRIFDPPGFPKMTVRGKKWMLLQALDRAGSEPISIEGLRDATSPATDASVRSNLQRLRADLSRHGLGDLIETVHGKGFRLRRKGTT